MIFTKELLDQVFANAILRTAKSIAADGDLTDFLPTEINNLISSSPAHREALGDLISAYSEWFNFHLTIDNEGRAGKLTSSEITRLGILMDKRDAAKERLLSLT